MKTLILILGFLLLPNLLWSAAPTSSYTYTTGEKILPSEVQQNETNIYQYLQSGVDTYADSTIVSADITDGTIVSADITDGTIVSADIANETITTSDILDGTIANADISGSAAIAYSKLNLGSSITSSDITDGTIVAGDIGTLTTIDINGGTVDGITSLTAGGDLDIGTYELRANTLESDVATGTAPLTIASTTKVTNLNADTVDGFNGGTGVPSDIQVFTSNGTWTKPAIVSTVYVKAVGGGGGGGGCGVGQNGSGGGGGGAYAEGLVTVTGDVTVTVGAGGAGGVGAADGSVGTDSSFGTDIVADNGLGGINNNDGAGGAGGTIANSTGTIKIPGGPGGKGDSGATLGGAGGSSLLGASTHMAPTTSIAGILYGGGGSGRGNADGNGGAGGAGMVIVMY